MSKKIYLADSFWLCASLIVINAKSVLTLHVHECHNNQFQVGCNGPCWRPGSTGLELINNKWVGIAYNKGVDRYNISLQLCPVLSQVYQVQMAVEMKLRALMMKTVILVSSLTLMKTKSNCIGTEYTKAFVLYIGKL